MTVDEQTAVAAWEHRGQTYYFCSADCFERFRGEPEHYLSLDPSERRM